MWEAEYSIWARFYPEGKNILDVGCEMESYSFFSLRGSKVYPIGDAFGSHVDGIKIDIDGGEWGMIVETHGGDPKLVKLHDFENGAKLYRLEKKNNYPMNKTRYSSVWRMLRVKIGLRTRLRR